MVWLVFVGLGLLAVGIAVYSLLSKSKAKRPGGAKSPSWLVKRRRLLVAGAIAVILLVGAAILYATLDIQRAPTGPEDSTKMAALSAEQLEKQLKDAPTSDGYKRLANMYFSAGQYEKAAAADHRAIELGSDDAVTWSEFGEAIVMASDGQVAPRALAAFTNAITRDPNDARSRYYIGMAEAQIGNMRQAVAIWRDLEKDSDPDAAWLPMVRQHVTAFSKQGGFDPESVPPATPSVSALRVAIAAMTDAKVRPPSSGNSQVAP